MSDLISRESLIKELNELRRYVPFPSSKDVFDIIMKAPAIAQGEPVAELKITWGSDTGYEYGLTLIGGALASQKAYDDWIVSNFKGDGVFKLYTTPQQPQSVADALEEAAKISDEVLGVNNISQRIRALIKRNVEPKACKWCNGQGYTETGIDESPTTICNNCDGIGTITPKEGE